MSRTHSLIPAIILILGLSLPAAAQSRRGELRGAWMNAAYGRDWPAIMASLKQNGFNAAFPNFSVGDIALYPSKVLTVAEGAQSGRDELATAAAAAKAAGIELHVWRINWALWQTPPELLEQLDAAGRLQRNSRGARGRDDPSVGVDWLCPSHPENRKLEKEAMLELVRSYDIAGIHFDYMRFPGDDYCFCDHCQEQFQKDAGVRVERWPEDVREGGPLTERWREWRRNLITSLAQEISDEAHRLKPDVCVSLAAWADLDDAREAYAQDWPTWVKQGVLDFVCPMDYTEDKEELARLLARQLGATRGEIPLYAGLGAYQLKSSAALIAEVETAREAGADGFVAFSYDSGKFAEWLPDLRATVAAADPDPMPHRSPPASFTFATLRSSEPTPPKATKAEATSLRSTSSGEAMSSSPADGQVLAGAPLEVEMTVGWKPASAEEKEAAGSPEAEAMLRHMLEQGRGPITTYDDRPSLPTGRADEPRISGRIVAEGPSGASLRVLGAFDADSWVSRQLRLPAPAGPFRIAVYGTQKIQREQQEFICRSRLLVGAKPEEVKAKAIHMELERLNKEACGRPELQQIAHLNAAFQLEATGPGGGQWWLRLREGECESGAGRIEKPDLAFTASAEDLLAIVRKEADPFLLWSSGRLKATGNLALLPRLWQALAWE